MLAKAYGRKSERKPHEEKKSSASECRLTSN
jgi:hypothetical protein